MRVHFIKDNDTSAIFFPDTMNFYEVNAFTKELVDRLNHGQSFDKIIRDTNTSLNDIESVQKLLSKNKEHIKPLVHRNENILGKLTLNITNTCNLGCKYCYAGGGSYSSDDAIMDDHFAIKILDKFYQRYDVIKVVQFFGGEPLLNLKAIKRICEYINNKYIKNEISEKPIFGIVTNGTIVNDELVELINSHDIKVTVSLDGPPSVNDKMRIYKDGSKTSTEIINNIKFLKSKTSQPSYIEATYNINHTKENVSVMDVVSFINEELNIDNVHIVPACGDDSSDFVLKDRESFIDSVDEIFNSIDNGEILSHSLVNKVLFSLKKKHTSRHLCEAGVSMLSVSTNGDLYPCFMFTDNENYKLGNIGDDDFFKSSKFKEKIDYIRSFSKFENPECKSCFNNTICTGCLGLNDLETGDIHSLSKPSCDMSRKITEKVILGIIKNKNKCKS